MQKGVKIISLFGLLILSFIISANLISAEYTPNYSCNITTVANCNAAVGGNIVMGVSAPTNAHGDFPYNASDNYPNVLCCYFGQGYTTCSPSANNLYYSSVGVNIPQNKIIGLTSPTNAHAEAPGQTNYNTNVCYQAGGGQGGLECISTNLASNPSGCSNLKWIYQDNVYYYNINPFNISNYTNAHIGVDNTAICCRIVGLNTACKLNSATWTYNSAMQGVQAGLNVTGTNCAGAEITFNVTDSNGNKVSNNPGDVIFPLNAPATSSVTSTWTAEYRVGQPNNYKFTALAIFNGNKISSGPPNATLITTQQPPSFCTSINTCSDYTPYGSANCTSDTSLCNVAKNDPNKDPKAYSYGCAWNTTSSKCNFVNIFQANGAISSPNGYTLCTNQTSGLSYSYPGNTCPGADYAPSNGNGVCEASEGCSSIDCSNGNQGNCVTGAKCQAGACYTAGVTPTNITQCANGYTLCLNPAKGLTYCNPSAFCPAGDRVTNNSCANSTILEGQNGIPSSCINSDASCHKIGGGGYCSSQSVSVGKCVYTFTGTSGNICTNGFINYSWTATWTGNTNKPSTCIDGQSVIECPAQILLPFFTTTNFVITIIVVAGIYVIIILVRKSKKHTIRHRRR